MIPPATASPSDTDRIRREERERIAALLIQLAEGHERFGNSAMGKLYELAKAEAFREAARRVGDLR